MRTVSECIDKRFTILHTLLIGHEQVKLPRRTIVHKLVHYVLVQTGSTSKKAIEEGRCRWDDVDADCNVDKDKVAALDDDADEEYGKRYLDYHDGDDVASLASNHPLWWWAWWYKMMARMSTFVNTCNRSTLVTWVPPPLHAMYKVDPQYTVNVIYQC
jgi:hypothetical protein